MRSYFTYSSENASIQREEQYRDGKPVGEHREYYAAEEQDARQPLRLMHYNGEGELDGQQKGRCGILRARYAVVAGTTVSRPW